MSAWILILTLQSGLRDGGVAIEHIDFPNRQACLVAGNTWLALWKEYALIPKAICVPRGDGP